MFHLILLTLCILTFSPYKVAAVTCFPTPNLCSSGQILYYAPSGGSLCASGGYYCAKPISDKTQSVVVPKTTSLVITTNTSKTLPLSYGMRSQEVLLLQQKLTSLGYLTADLQTGFFGKLTLSAVKRFQHDRNLEPVGYIGPKTKALIATITQTSTTTTPKIIPKPSVLPEGGKNDGSGSDGGRGMSTTTQPSQSTTTYIWHTGDWSDCANDTQTRTVQCKNNSNQAIVDSSCVATKPAITQSCVSSACTFDNKSIAHGATITTYQTATVPAGQICAQETRTCANGSLSGTYVYTSCTAVTPTNVFRPESYGAKADNATDSTVGIQKAIAAAKAYGAPAIVQLSAGTYRVSCTPGQGPSELGSTQFCFDIHSSKDLTIQGDGSANTHIIITTPTSGLFSLSYNKYSPSEKPNENITLAGFSIDFDPLPYTQGTIVAVNASANTIDVALDAGYPLPDSASFAPQIYATYEGPPLGQLVSPTSLQRKPGSDAWYFTSPVGKVSGSTWRYRDLHGVIGTKAAVGDRFFSAGGRGGSTDINVSGVNGGTFRDITMYSGSGGYVFYETSGVMTLDSVQIRPKPGTNRILSVNSNATISIHNWSSQRITNSYLEASGDDLFDSGSGGNLVKGVVSATQLRTESTYTIRPGDRIQVVDPCGVLRGEANVTDISRDAPYGTYTMTLDAPINGVRASGGTASCTVGGSSPISSYDADIVYDLSAAGPNMLIQNNTLANAARIRLRGAGSRVSGNTMRDTGHIDLSYEASWRGGPLADSITIDGNTMTSRLGWPGYILISNARGRPIVVSNNTIINSRPGGILIRDASNITLSNNSIINDASHPTTNPPIWLDHASGIVINNLTINDPNSSASAGLFIGSSVGVGNAGVHISGLNTSGLNPSVPPIKDERAPTTYTPPFPSSIIHRWELNENTGTSLASATGGVVGTISGNASWQKDAFGRIYLSLTGGYLDFGTSTMSTNQDAFTASVWLKLDTLPATGVAVTPLGKDANGTPSWRFILSQNDVHAVIRTVNNEWYTAGTTATAWQPLPINVWTNLTMTYDGSRLKLYVNGTLAAENASPNPSGAITGTAALLHAGLGGYVSTIGPYVGNIDEITLWNIALDATSIANMVSSFNVQ